MMFTTFVPGVGQQLGELRPEHGVPRNLLLGLGADEAAEEVDELAVPPPGWKDLRMRGLVEALVRAQLRGRGGGRGEGGRAARPRLARQGAAGLVQVAANKTFYFTEIYVLVRKG